MSASTAPAKWVEPAEFFERMRAVRGCSPADFVTGPGRSGAIAAVYASYALGLPFVAWGQFPKGVASALIVDTAAMSGWTIRRARARYEALGYAVTTFVAFDESEQRHHFWFERMAAPRRAVAETLDMAGL